MSQIVQQGAINTTALVVPDLYVQIVPPQNLLLNGVPSNIVGIVGTASWGPVGQAITVSSMADYAKAFGPVMARKYDLGTPVAAATQQGANAFRCVRVTDGTDIAASAVVLTNCITFTALYTGSLGNTVSVTVSAGSKAATSRVTVALAGSGNVANPTPEVFDNIAGTGNAFWLAMAAAINFGTSVLRGPSQIITASAGIGTTAVSLSTYNLAGGTDGVTTLAASVLIGSDTVPRKGMYALRSQGCSVVMLADADDNTQWAGQVAFGTSENAYMILVTPAGDTIANAAAVKATAGIDTYVAKMMLGDWIYWQDTTNNVVRLISPQGFIAGRLGNLDPSQSSLNKPIYGVIGTQKTGLPSNQVTTYSVADLTTMIQAGIDVITNPAPGGNYFAARAGHNCSSNVNINGDNYTRMTFYISVTLAAGMGIYVGRVISPTLFTQARGTMNSFLANLLGQGLLKFTSSGALPYSVICDATNNPDSRTGLGYLQIDAQVKYAPIAEKFIVNVEGGQTVQVTRQTLPTGQIGA
jgi:hypothetical protein